MATCKSCNNNILSQTPSLIGETNCNQPCPSGEVTCTDIIGSNCVFYSGPTVTCPSTQTNIVTNGQTMSQVVQLLAAQICNSGSGEKCFDWENVTFDKSGFVNVGLYPPTGSTEWENVLGSSVQYTIDKVNCKAGLQGVCKNNVEFGASSNQKTYCISKLFSLPPSITPSVQKAISTSVVITPDPGWEGNYFPLIISGMLYITVTGEVIIQFSDFSPWEVYPSFCTIEGCEASLAAIRYYWLDGDATPTSPAFLVATVSLDGIYYDL